jgi:hypothetical protein
MGVGRVPLSKRRLSLKAANPDQLICYMGVRTISTRRWYRLPSSTAET